ncbi:MAG TPA: prolipoprotein diacylglyceryl transferase family protein [Tepidisphaeraceae bacterium]|jgi:phosphatidylglycerol:prolipoprotein diacylglycerol transferase
MHPELFKIPFVNFTLHSYGLLLVIGLLLAMQLAKFLARRSGIDGELFVTAGILALVSGLIGARIVYVLQNFHEFTGGSFVDNVLSAINLTSGGLVYYGGFLLATPTLIVWGLLRKIPILRGMDIIAPCLMIGLALGRVGCFLNGCCWGEVAEVRSPVGVTFPYQSGPYLEHVHDGVLTPNLRLYRIDPVTGRGRPVTAKEAAADPALAPIAAGERSLRVLNTQLISTITALLIAAVTTAYFSLYGMPGRGFALMMVLEGITRTLIEGLRVEPAVLGPLTLSMCIGLAVSATGLVMWFAVKHLRDLRGFGERPGYPAAA